MKAVMQQMVSLADDFCIIHLVLDGDVFLNAKKLPKCYKSMHCVQIWET